MRNISGGFRKACLHTEVFRNLGYEKPGWNEQKGEEMMDNVKIARELVRIAKCIIAMSKDAEKFVRNNKANYKGGSALMHYRNILYSCKDIGVIGQDDIDVFTGKNGFNEDAFKSSLTKYILLGIKWQCGLEACPSQRSEQWYASIRQITYPGVSNDEWNEIYEKLAKFHAIIINRMTLNEDSLKWIAEIFHSNDMN